MSKPPRRPRPPRYYKWTKEDNQRLARWVEEKQRREGIETNASSPPRTLKDLSPLEAIGIRKRRRP